MAKARALGRRQWTVAEVAEITVLADGQRLTQALLQLAANAVQHTRDGDKISVGSAVTGGRLLLWVSDFGSGIAPEDHERIFERFARGSDRAALTALVWGSIVRTIVQVMAALCVLKANSAGGDLHPGPAHAARLCRRCRAAGGKGTAVNHAPGKRSHLDLRTRRAQVADRTVDLTAREFALAEVFCRHPDQVLSREQLLSTAGLESTSTLSPTWSMSMFATCAANWVPSGWRRVRGMGYRLRSS